MITVRTQAQVYHRFVVSRNTRFTVSQSHSSALVVVVVVNSYGDALKVDVWVRWYWGWLLGKCYSFMKKSSLDWVLEVVMTNLKPFRQQPPHLNRCVSDLAGTLAGLHYSLGVGSCCWCCRCNGLWLAFPFTFLRLRRGFPCRVVNLNLNAVQTQWTFIFCKLFSHGICLRVAQFPL